MTDLPMDSFDYDPMVATIDRLPADWQALLRDKWKRAGLPALKGPNVRAFTPDEVERAKELVETTRRRAVASDDLRRGRVTAALAQRGIRKPQDVAEAIGEATDGEAASATGLTWEQVEAVEMWCQLPERQSTEAEAATDKREEATSWSRSSNRQARGSNVMEQRKIRPFGAWLHEQRGGAAHAELSDSLNELVEAVAATGRPGELTFKLKIKPAGKGDHGTVIVSDSTTVKLPEPERGESIFFVDEDANLARNNPAQVALPLREVPRPDDVDENGEREAK